MAEQAVVRRRARKPMLYVVGFFAMIFGALPTATIVMVGMVPTLVAFLVDWTPGRFLMKCVASMNIAGLLPWLYKLWFSGHDMRTAISMVTDLFMWFVVYAASGIGWALFLGLPSMVAMTRLLNAKRRIYVLRERQKSLFDEWGECILPASEKRALGSEESDGEPEIGGTQPADESTAAEPEPEPAARAAG